MSLVCTCLRLTDDDRLRTGRWHVGIGCMLIYLVLPIGTFQYTAGSIVNFTLVSSALKTLRIVSNRALVKLFSIFDI